MQAAVAACSGRACGYEIGGEMQQSVRVGARGSGQVHHERVGAYTTAGGADRGDRGASTCTADVVGCVSAARRRSATAPRAPGVSRP